MILENCNEKNCGNWEVCKGKDLHRLCRCIVWDLSQHNLGIIYVSNGTEGENLAKALYDILKNCSTKEEEVEP